MLKGRGQRRRGRCQWSMIDGWKQQVSVLLAAVTYGQLLVAVDSSAEMTSSVIQLGPCRARVNQTVLDLGRLYGPTNATAR